MSSVDFSNVLADAATEAAAGQVQPKVAPTPAATAAKASDLHAGSRQAATAATKISRSSSHEKPGSVRRARMLPPGAPHKRVTTRVPAPTSDLSSASGAAPTLVATPVAASPSCSKAQRTSSSPASESTSMSLTSTGATGTSAATGPEILLAGDPARSSPAAAPSDASSSLDTQPGASAEPSVTAAPAMSAQPAPAASVEQSKHPATPTAAQPARDRSSDPAGVAVAPPEIGRDETGGLSIRVSLPHIGALEVRVVDDKNGPTSLVIGAEREDTLRALIGDQARLHASLRENGIKPEGRTIEFSLILPSPTDNGASRGDPGAHDDPPSRHAAASDVEPGSIGPAAGSARLSGSSAGCGRSLNLIDITA